MGDVTAVVCATFDPRLDGAVRREVALLADAGLNLRTPPRHPPHLTLGAARVGSANAVAEVAAEIAARLEQAPIVLDHIGIFPSGGVLWLGPRPDPGLAGLQRACDGTLREHWRRAFGEQTNPERWVAHCTLATRLSAPDLARAVQIVARRRRPLRGTITALTTIVVGGTGVHAAAPLARPSP